MKIFLNEIRKNKIGYAMALPAVLIIVAFCYIPFYYTITAFQKYNYLKGVLGSPWVGLENFKFFFGPGGKAFQVTTNTLVMNFYFIISSIVVTVTMSILVNEIKNKMFKKVSQTMYFFPYFLSWVIIGEIVYSIFSSEYGSLNNLLVSLGVDPVQWYKHPEYWRPILVFCNIWKNAGYGMLVYLATMSSFDTSLYEAAIVDGANKLQCIFRITLPLLKPTILILTLYSLGRIFFGDFGMVYGVVRDVGPLLTKVEIIDTYVYRAYRQTGLIGMATAIGLYQSVFGFITILLSNYIVKKHNEGSALF